MVTIINFKERETEDGKSFFVLELQGGIEMVQSKATGKFYATARKTSIPTTFDELTCNALIGTQMQGEIVKEQCEAYELTVKETGEVMVLNHRFVYTQQVPETKKPQEPFYDSLKPNVESFSKNGKHELEYA